ncbi:MAG: 3-isopropylmalate dehydrogenase [Dehalococcoidia bacterium]
MTDEEMMVRAKIAVIPGDGIGPEVVAEGVKALQKVGNLYGHRFDLSYGVAGGAAIDRFGTALPEDTPRLCRRSDAILFGAVGGPKWDDPKSSVRPEQGLLTLRKGLRLFANLRPLKVFRQLKDSTPIKPSILDGVDMVVVRELTGGLYFGKPKGRWRSARGRRAKDSMAYSEEEIKRILRVGFELALKRRRKLTSVDKANILESSRLWRELALEMSTEYPEVDLDHVLVDACAMHLIRQPARFDVIVTENTFGDILTDEASVLAGSMGMLPSASLNMNESTRGGRSIKTLGLYEPVHGSAPDIAGQDKANPIAMVLSVAMMLRYSFGLDTEAQAIERSVERVLEEGYRTPDIMQEGMKLVGTEKMGSLIVERISSG